jgi:hypothetical protein
MGAGVQTHKGVLTLEKEVILVIAGHRCAGRECSLPRSHTHTRTASHCFFSFLELSSKNETDESDETLLRQMRLIETDELIDLTVGV